MTIRLLITARDAAAALHLTQIALAAQADARFDVRIVAQMPAAGYFRQAGLPVQVLDAPAARTAGDDAAVSLRKAARSVLNEVTPDVVLTGLSTPFDAGLDEAMLVESVAPTVLLQDFWGEQNLILGKPADHILAVDDEAVRLNLARFGVRSLRIGSARHAAYRQLDSAGARARQRQRLGVAADAAVIGFFGQALHQLAGYRRTIEHFIACVKALGMPHLQVLVRPHPREDANRRLETSALFAHSGLAVLQAQDGTVEDDLMACDVSCSLFSTCTYDAAYLNRFAVSPLTVPVSMLFDPEIATYCAQHVNFDTFPYHRDGVVLAVHEADALGPTLASALRPSTQEAVWRNAHAHLPDPARAPALALDAVTAIAHKGRA